MKSLFVIVAALLLAGCTRTRYTTREMTWTTEPNQSVFHPLPPDSVRLTFADRPDDHILLEGVPQLIKHMRSSGKTTVPAYFEVHCALRDQHVCWYSLHTVDGISVVPGGGSAERTGDSRAADPLSAACP